MSTSGVNDILGEHIPKSIHSFIYSFFGAFESTSFFINNLFLTTSCLLGLTLFLITKQIDKKNYSTYFLMFLWVMVPILIFSLFNYRPDRFYYLIIPSMCFWIIYGLQLKEKQILLNKKLSLKFILGLLILSFLISFLLSQSLKIFNSFTEVPIPIQRILSSHYKIIIIFSFLMIFNKVFKYFILNHFNRIIFFIKVCVILTIYSNVNVLIDWVNEDNDNNIITQNNRVAEILKENNEYKVAGQWSSAFTFNNKLNQSFPIKLGSYNDNIISENGIKYLFVEKNRYTEQEILKLIGKNKTIELIDILYVAQRYEVHLYKIKSVI